MGRLKMKGAPPRNLKRARKTAEPKEEAEAQSSDEEGRVEPEGWVHVETMDDLKGPIVVISSNGHLLSVGESGVPALEGLPGPADDFEPAEVAQVMVGKQLLPGVFCLQSAFSRYVSSDPLGAVTATKEAVGQGERWIPELLGDGTVAFKSAFDRYLSVGETGLRADSEAVSDGERFTVRCQAALRWMRKRAAPRTSQLRAVDPREAEAKSLREFHSYTPGPVGTSKTDAKDLASAQAEGRLREALLERRVKSKGDKFC